MRPSRPATRAARSSTRDGQVIGINSAGIPSTQNANSLGFAIPAPTVTSIVNQLLQNGSASHAYLGISGTDSEQGLVVDSVSPGSAASAAGIQAGDVIVAFDGQPVNAGSDLVSDLREKAAGDVVVVTVERNGARTDLNVTLGERPAQPAA